MSFVTSLIAIAAVGAPQGGPEGPQGPPLQTYVGTSASLHQGFALNLVMLGDTGPPGAPRPEFERLLSVSVSVGLHPGSEVGGAWTHADPFRLGVPCRWFGLHVRASASPNYRAWMVGGVEAGEESPGP